MNERSEFSRLQYAVDTDHLKTRLFLALDQLDEARDELSCLQAENEKLVEALKKIISAIDEKDWVDFDTKRIRRIAGDAISENNRHTPKPNNDDYDAQKDFGNSLNECYRVIRERMAAGGPGWVHKAPPKENK